MKLKHELQLTNKYQISHTYFLRLSERCLYNLLTSKHFFKISCKQISFWLKKFEFYGLMVYVFIDIEKKVKKTY